MHDLFEELSVDALLTLPVDAPKGVLVGLQLRDGKRSGAHQLEHLGLPLLVPLLSQLGARRFADFPHLTMDQCKLIRVGAARQVRRAHLGIFEKVAPVLVRDKHFFRRNYGTPLHHPEHDVFLLVLTTKHNHISRDCEICQSSPRKATIFFLHDSSTANTVLNTPT